MTNEFTRENITKLFLEEKERKEKRDLIAKDKRARRYDLLRLAAIEINEIYNECNKVLSGFKLLNGNFLRVKLDETTIMDDRLQLPKIKIDITCDGLNSVWRQLMLIYPIVSSDGVTFGIDGCGPSKCPDLFHRCDLMSEIMNIIACSQNYKALNEKDFTEYE